jgi:hypothetical protein
MRPLTRAQRDVLSEIIGEETEPCAAELGVPPDECDPPEDFDAEAIDALIADRRIRRGGDCALNVWDEDQLAAWKAWAADPWRP